MPRYRVEIERTTFTTVIVEAPSKKLAILHCSGPHKDEGAVTLETEEEDEQVDIRADEIDE